MACTLLGMKPETCKGGGIHAKNNSSIVVNEGLQISGNEAKNGGGISLEGGAKLYRIADTENPIIELVQTSSKAVKTRVVCSIVIRNRIN